MFKTKLGLTAQAQDLFRKGASAASQVCHALQDNWDWQEVEAPADSPRPSARDFPGIVPLPGNKLLIFGGLDAAAKRLDDTWIFDCTQ